MAEDLDATLNKLIGPLVSSDVLDKVGVSAA
jgi:hypothetical protein